MFLHIGNGQTVDKADIIGLFDMDTATVSEKTKQFLAKAETKNEIRYDETDIPKTFIVCVKREKEPLFYGKNKKAEIQREKKGVRERRDKNRNLCGQTVYFSKISPKTLALRSDTPFAVSDEAAENKEN